MRKVKQGIQSIALEKSQNFVAAECSLSRLDIIKKGKHSIIFTNLSIIFDNVARSVIVIGPVGKISFSNNL